MRILIIGSVLFCAEAALAQTETKSLGPLGDPFIGNVGYYATGNTMAMPIATKNDGLACRLVSNTASVPAATIGPRATLEKAYLYYSGSVYKYNTGVGGRDLTQIDKDVSLLLPGQTTATNLKAETIYSSEITYGNHFGKTYFFTARADFTEALKATRTMAGTYTFSGFDTQVCDVAPEPVCPAQCPDGAENLVATASFFIVLVFKDPALPPRAVKLFDGLETLTSTSPPRTITLDDIKVSAIPRGQLTLYGLEGDANLTGDQATISANGRAAVQLGNVIEPPPPAPTSKTCGDVSWPNWTNNLFDSSTVLDPTKPEEGQCTRGIDIDTFDISSVLQPNDSTVNINVLTTGETIGIAFAAVQVDIFRPVIDVDSRKQVLFRQGSNSVEPNGTLVYRVGISNTGNIPATGISVTDSMPLGTANLTVLKTPPGSTDMSTQTGGNSNAGLVNVTNITVNPGDIFEVRYSVDVPCPVPDGLALINSAAISNSNEGAPGTTLFSPTYRVSDPNADICEGRGTDPNPDDIPDVFKTRKLLGGAGCNASGVHSAWMALVLLGFLRKRRKVLLVALGLVLAPNCTCRNFVPPPEVPAPSGPAAPTMMEIPKAPEVEPAHPGTACPTAADMILLDSGVCIDRFEAVVENGVAKVTFAAVPSANLDYNTAKSACEAAGKRLCTGAEWEKACRGTKLTLYPYGDSSVPATCNGFDAEWGEAVQAGAMTTCASDVGAFDMSGNLNEWVNTDYPYVNAQGTIVTGKQLRGGSFIGNASGLTCTALAAADPAQADNRTGVRCCK